MLIDLTEGNHTLTVYVTDSFGNVEGQDVNFNIAQPFPVVTVVTVASLTVFVIDLGLLVYNKKNW